MLISNTGLLMVLEHRYVFFYFLLSTLRERRGKLEVKLEKDSMSLDKEETRQAGLD